MTIKQDTPQAGNGPATHPHRRYVAEHMSDSVAVPCVLDTRTDPPKVVYTGGSDHDADLIANRFEKAHRHRALAAGLRELADFIYAHEPDELPLIIDSLDRGTPEVRIGVHRSTVDRYERLVRELGCDEDTTIPGLPYTSCQRRFGPYVAFYVQTDAIDKTAGA